MQRIQFIMSFVLRESEFNKGLRFTGESLAKDVIKISLFRFEVGILKSHCHLATPRNLSPSVTEICPAQ
jgi:hypothetical protein